MFIIQMMIMIPRVRPKVITCQTWVNLNPKRRAASLSTLIAVNVNNDTPQKN